MKKLCPLHNIVQSYWSNDNFVFHVYLHSLDVKGVLDSFLDKHLVTKHLLTKKNTIINLYEYRGKQFILKEVANESQSSFEHQAFVGYQAINHMNDYYKSNFVYTYYHKRCTSTSRNYLLIEYKQANTLFDMLITKKIQFYELISVYIQLLCILQYSQDSFTFLHMDMMPWNILIKEFDQDQTFVFKEAKLKVVSKFQPIIIDYEKSHVVLDGKSYYTLVPFYPNKLTDVLFLVFKTLDCIFQNETPLIFNNKYCQKKEDRLKKLLNLRNKQKFLDHVRNLLGFFINDEDELLGTYYIDEYNKTTVNLVNRDIDRFKSFLKLHTKYSTLLDIIKTFSFSDEYKDRTPISFLHHILSNNIHDSTSVSVSFRYLSSLTKSHLYIHPFNVCDLKFYQIITFMKNILRDQSNSIISNGHISHFGGFINMLWERYSKKKNNYLDSSTFLYVDEFTQIVTLFKERFDSNFTIKNLKNVNEFLPALSDESLRKYISFIRTSRAQANRLIAPVHSIYSPEYTQQNTTRNDEYYKTIKLLYHHVYSNPKQINILFNELETASFFDLMMF